MIVNMINAVSEGRKSVKIIIIILFKKKFTKYLYSKYNYKLNKVILV